VHQLGARYLNRETLVQFDFAWVEDAESFEEDFEEESEEEIEQFVQEAAMGHQASFFLDVISPSFFWLEAEQELEEFLDFFEFKLRYPGMEYSSFSRQEFLHSLSEHRKEVLPDFREEHGENTLRWPKEELHNIWSWNFHRSERNEALEVEESDHLGYPQLQFVQGEEGVGTAAVWRDAQQILLPKVDMLALAVRDIGPKKIFGGRKKFLSLRNWEDIMPFLEGIPSKQEGEIECYQLDKSSFNRWDDLRDFFLSSPQSEKIIQISPARIFESELFED
jgi:hypothetical protein